MVINLIILQRMSCQSAINLVFGLSNTDYLRAFPDALSSLHARFPGGVVRYARFVPDSLLIWPSFS